MGMEHAGRPIAPGSSRSHLDPRKCPPGPSNCSFRACPLPRLLLSLPTSRLEVLSNPSGYKALKSYTVGTTKSVSSLSHHSLQFLCRGDSSQLSIRVQRSAKWPSRSISSDMNPKTLNQTDELQTINPTTKNPTFPKSQVSCLVPKAGSNK